MNPILHSRMARCLIVAGIIGFTAGDIHVQAQTPHAGAAATGYNQTTAVLVWQGRVLPIVTDTIASLQNLSNAIQKNDLSGVSRIADEFAGELVRFKHISPTPADVKQTSTLFIKGLSDLSVGTKTLALGLRTSSRTVVLRAASQVDSGALEFQNAIDQIRRKSGPAGEPTVVPQYAGPTPTPIIRGLP
jgi:hypothetical protein